jgi:hypothetical protein
VLQRDEIGTGIKTQGIREVPPGILVCLERLALATVDIEGEHEQPPEPLAPGIVRQQATDLTDDLPR